MIRGNAAIAQCLCAVLVAFCPVLLRATDLDNDGLDDKAEACR